MKRLPLCLALFLTLAAAPNFARAESSTLLRVECSENLSFLRIDQFSLEGESAHQYAMQHIDQLWDKEKTVLHNALIETGPDLQWQKSHPITTECSLNTKIEGPKKYKKQKYSITVEPYLFNTNPHNQCGSARAFEVTIKTKDYTLVDHVRFWYNCLGDSGNQMENEQVLNSLLFDAESNHIEFSGYYLNMKNKGFHRSFWVDEDLPITSDKLYFSNKK